MKRLLSLLLVFATITGFAQTESPLYKLKPMDTYMGHDGLPYSILIDMNSADATKIENDAILYMFKMDTEPAHFTEPYEQDGVESIDSVTFYVYDDIFVGIQYFLFIEDNELYEQHVMMISTMLEE